MDDEAYLNRGPIVRGEVYTPFNQRGETAIEALRNDEEARRRQAKNRKEDAPVDPYLEPDALDKFFEQRDEYKKRRGIPISKETPKIVMRPECLKYTEKYSEYDFPNILAEHAEKKAKQEAANKAAHDLMVKARRQDNPSWLRGSNDVTAFSDGQVAAAAARSFEAKEPVVRPKVYEEKPELIEGPVVRPKIKKTKPGYDHTVASFAQEAASRASSKMECGQNTPRYSNYEKELPNERRFIDHSQSQCYEPMRTNTPTTQFRRTTSLEYEKPAPLTIEKVTPKESPMTLFERQFHRATSLERENPVKHMVETPTHTESTRSVSQERDTPSPVKRRDEKLREKALDIQSSTMEEIFEFFEEHDECAKAERKAAALKKKKWEEKRERERLEMKRLDRERLEREQREQERQEQERLEREQQEQERQEEERQRAIREAILPAPIGRNTQVTGYSDEQLVTSLTPVESFEFRPIPKTARGRAGSNKREAPKEEPKKVVPRPHPKEFLEHKDERRQMPRTARGRELEAQRRAGPSHVGSMDPDIPAKPPKMDQNMDKAVVSKPPKGAARDRSSSKRRDNSEARRRRKVGFAMDVDHSQEALKPKPDVKHMSAAERWIYEAKEENRKLEMLEKKTSGGECLFIGFGDEPEEPQMEKIPRRIRFEEVKSPEQRSVETASRLQRRINEADSRRTDSRMDRAYSAANNNIKVREARNRLAAQRREKEEELACDQAQKDWARAGLLEERREKARACSRIGNPAYSDEKARAQSRVRFIVPEEETRAFELELLMNRPKTPFMKEEPVGGRQYLDPVERAARALATPVWEQPKPKPRKSRKNRMLRHSTRIVQPAEASQPADEEIADANAENAGQENAPGDRSTAIVPSFEAAKEALAVCEADLREHIRELELGLEQMLEERQELKDRIEEYEDIREKILPSSVSTLTKIRRRLRKGWRRVKKIFGKKA